MLSQATQNNYVSDSEGQMHQQSREKDFNYKLILSDKRVWGFTAPSSIFSWLKEFADIMQLQKAAIDDDIDHKIVFLALKNADSFLQLKDDLSHWAMYKNGKVYRIWSHSTIPEIFIELNQNFIYHSELRYVNMWSSLKPVFKYYLENGGGPAHAASAELNGKGILIAGYGGAGKSTSIRRLPDYWQPLSDDTTLIVNPNNNYSLHPMPTWSDHLRSERNTTFKTSYSAPLSAIFFLEQDNCDKVMLLDKNAALQSLHESQRQTWESYWSRVSAEEKKRMNTHIFNNSYNIVNKIPCYILKATLHGKFWEKIEEVL